MGYIAFGAATVLAASIFFGSPAQATGLQFNSMPVFLGTVTDQHGNLVLGFEAQIISTTPDAQGYIEVFTHQVVDSQESYADHLAIKTRAACNASGDNSCVLGQPNWRETLLMVVSQ